MSVYNWISILRITSYNVCYTKLLRDGRPDSEEAGDNPNQPKDTDGDGTPDYRDLDSDNDGVPDKEDKQDNPPKQNQNQQQRPKDQMSEEEAQRLLNAIQQDENALQEKLQKRNNFV